MPQDLKNGLAAAFVSGPQETKPAQAEPAKKKTRKSDIVREPMKRKDGQEIKIKRKRACKPAELRKSRSISVLMTEQMYQAFKAISENEGASMNGIICKLVRKYIIAHDIDDDLLDI